MKAIGMLMIIFLFGGVFIQFVKPLTFFSNNELEYVKWKSNKTNQNIVNDCIKNNNIDNNTTTTKTNKNGMDSLVATPPQPTPQLTTYSCVEIIEKEDNIKSFKQMLSINTKVFHYSISFGVLLLLAFIVSKKIH